MQTIIKPQNGHAEANDVTGGDSLDRLVRLSDVDPRKSIAFSPNLYRWLRKNRSMRLFADRYEAEGVEYLGFLDDGGFLIGSRLWGVLCNGGGERTWAFSHLGMGAIHRPLWADYLKRGRCAIDPNHEHHFIDDRYIVSGKTRACQWCGHVQRREIYTVSEKRERWVDVPNSDLSD